MAMGWTWEDDEENSGFSPRVPLTVAPLPKTLAVGVAKLAVGGGMSACASLSPSYPPVRVLRIHETQQPGVRSPKLQVLQVYWGLGLVGGVSTSHDCVGLGDFSCGTEIFWNYRRNIFFR